MQSAQVYAVIVLWHPDIAALSSLLTAIAPQVTNVLLIANDGEPPALQLPRNADVFFPGANIGLGAAYNRAAEWARARDGTHLLLLDQDSLPGENMVARLLAAFELPGPIAATGPLWRECRTKQDGFFVRLTRCGVRKCFPTEGATLPADFLISSGSLISLSALERIGPFDERLFIEHVDTDWCLRARANGWALYGVAAARLDHAMGQAVVTVPILGKSRQLFVHPPERNYYLLRNSIILWRRPYAPTRWVLHDVRRTTLLMIYYAALVPPRVPRLKCMARAVRDAIRGTL